MKDRRQYPEKSTVRWRYREVSYRSRVDQIMKDMYFIFRAFKRIGVCVGIFSMGRPFCVRNLRAQKTLSTGPPVFLKTDEFLILY